MERLLNSTFPNATWALIEQTQRLTESNLFSEEIITVKLLQE